MQAAEYAVDNRVSLEPDFSWWDPYVLKKLNRIISNIKYKYWVQTHKYGIKVPNNAEQAKAVDKKNGNTLWWDSIKQDMKNVCPYFEEWEGTFD